MPTIEEMNSNMTIFYSKSSGDIKSLATGIQDMDMFGVNAADYSIIWDFVVLAIDDYVLKNPDQFKINLATKTLEMLAGAMPEYPTAES